MNLKFKNTWIFIGLLQVLLVIYLCLRPTPNITPLIAHLDKLFHFSAYLLLTFFQLQIYEIKYSRTIFMTLLIQGILIEILQFFTGYRSFEFWDIFANASGSLYAILFCAGFNLRPLERIEKLALKNTFNLS
jgi:VanZ family protein